MRNINTTSRKDACHSERSEESLAPTHHWQLIKEFLPEGSCEAKR
jgi:hypothetical protein